MICAVHGYKTLCVVDPKTPQANLKLYKILGAEIEMVVEKDENGGYQKARIKRTKEIARTRENCIDLDQYANPAAREIHYHTTGPEIFRQLEGRVDVLVANASTGSHLCGTARYLKEQRLEILIIGVEPVGSVVFGGVPSSYLQNGTGLCFTPRNYDPTVVDREVKVSDQDAMFMVRRVARENGILLGGSSGAALFEAFSYAKTCQGPTNIVVIFPDAGANYMETIYDDLWMAEHGLFVAI